MKDQIDKREFFERHFVDTANKNATHAEEISVELVRQLILAATVIFAFQGAFLSSSSRVQVSWLLFSLAAIFFVSSIICGIKQLYDSKNHYEKIGDTQRAIASQIAQSQEPWIRLAKSVDKKAKAIDPHISSDSMLAQVITFGFGLAALALSLVAG